MSSVNSVISNVLNAYYGSASTVSSTSDADETSSASSSSSADESSSVSYSDETSLGRYLNSTSSDDVSAKKIFEKLSIDLGGGGKTITKDQLGDYIEQAEDEEGSIPDEELDVLNELYDNWDKAADGEDEITYSRLVSTGYKENLLSVVPEEDDSASESLQDDFNESTIAAYSKVLNSALGGLSTGDDDEDSQFSLIKTLLSLEENDDDSSKDLLKTLLSSNITSTLELEA